MNTLRALPGPSVGLLLLPLVLAPACSDSGGGGGGGGSGSSAFLEIEERIDTAPAGASGSQRPQVAASGDRVVVIWEDARSGVGQELYCNVSTDAGQSWRSSDILVPAPGPGVGDIDLHAGGLLVDGLDVVVAFEQSDAATGFDDVHVNVSSDGGLTWLPQAVRVDTDAPYAADSSSPRLVAGGAKLYLVWHDERNGQRDVYFSRSTDGGLTWLASDVRLDSDDPGEAESEDPRIAADGDRVYVVWTDGRNGGSDIYFNSSSDGGQTWLPADVRLGTTNPGEYDPYAPVIAADGSDLLVAWLDDRDGNWGVWFTRSADGGATWSPEVRLDTTPAGTDCEEVELVLEGQRAFVGWKSKRNGQDDVFLNVSDDRGATWLAQEIRMDTDAPGAGDTDDLTICAVGDDVVVSWEDDRNGFDDIYLNYSRDGGATWLSSDLQVEKDAPGAHDADRPRMACSSSGFWIAWEDHRNGEKDIYVNGGELPSSQPD